MTNSAYIDVNMCLYLHRPPCCSLSCSIIITVVDQAGKPNVLLLAVDSVEIIIFAVVFNHGCCVLALPSCFLFLSVNCETVSVLC